MRQPIHAETVVGWDDIRLREVWSEFVWFCQAHGLRSVEQLSERNRYIYDVLRAEMRRRGTQLTIFD